MTFGKVRVQQADPISNDQWRAYVLAQLADRINTLALTVELGEQDARIIEARSAWRRGDIADAENS
jgi:hypothetical protein